MVEEGILKNIIESNDLVNADIYIGVSSNSYKIGLSKSPQKISVLEEINIAPETIIWDLLSISPQDLKECNSIIIVTHSEVYTLVPSAFYEDQHKTDYLLQLTTVDKSLPVITEFIKEIDAYLIFQPADMVLSLLNELPPQTTVHHHAAILISYELKRIRSSKPTVFIHFESHYFNCIITKDRQLLYSNSQQFITASDAIYFILSIYQQHKMDPNEIEVFISGKIMPYSELHNILLRFINKVEWFHTPSEISLGALGSTKSDHLFADLIRLAACV